MLQYAEVLDAWRIFPRLVLLLFLIANTATLNWYFDYEVKYTTQCDAQVIKVVLDSGQPLDKAREIGCTVTEVVGHPTGYTALVSTLVGSSAAVFGFYMNSGRNWGGARRERE